MKTIIFDYENALKSKVGKSVNEKIWTLELMEIYGQTYEYFTEVLDYEIYELAKQKMISERKKNNKN